MATEDRDEFNQKLAGETSSTVLACLKKSHGLMHTRPGIFIAIFICVYIWYWLLSTCSIFIYTEHPHACKAREVTDRRFLKYFLMYEIRNRDRREGCSL